MPTHPPTGSVSILLKQRDPMNDRTRDFQDETARPREWKRNNLAEVKNKGGKTYGNGNAKSRSFPSKTIDFKEQPRNILVRTAAAGKKGNKNILFLSCFHSKGCRRRKYFFFVVVNCQHAVRATIDVRFRHRLSPRPTRLVSGKANE